MVRVAVVGCCHGELNKIYGSIQPGSIDLLIICGDFQAIRNKTDLETISVPQKYKQLGDFHEYYSGKKVAPVLTIFIGGNHECSSYLKELKFGGFVAPNIYYLGEFGCVLYMGLRITGQSGIWNDYSFMQSDTREWKLPYDQSTLRSVYHIKSSTFLKSYLMKSDDEVLDIALSHDWPKDIVYSGNLQQLLRYKPFFKQDIESGKLGNPLAKILLHRLRARYWFAAHLHVRFSANVKHEARKRSASVGDTNEAKKNKKNNDEIELDMDEEEPHNKEEIVLDMDEPQTPIRKNNEEIELDMDEPAVTSNLADTADTSKTATPPAVMSTTFLALDKCLPKRKYIEFLTINPVGQIDNQTLFYDRRAIAVNKVIENFTKKNPIWSTITKNQLLNIETSLGNLVDELNEEINFEIKKLESLSQEKFIIDPTRFEVIAPAEGEASEIPLKYWGNNQTEYYFKEFLD